MTSDSRKRFRSHFGGIVGFVEIQALWSTVLVMGQVASTQGNKQEAVLSLVLGPLQFWCNRRVCLFLFESNAISKKSYSLMVLMW